MRGKGNMGGCCYRTQCTNGGKVSMCRDVKASGNKENEARDEETRRGTRGICFKQEPVGEQFSPLGVPVRAPGKQT